GLRAIGIFFPGVALIPHADLLTAFISRRMVAQPDRPSAGRRGHGAGPSGQTAAPAGAFRPGRRRNTSAAPPPGFPPGHGACHAASRNRTSAWPAWHGQPWRRTVHRAAPRRAPHGAPDRARPGSAFFKIVVTVLLLSRLPHRQFRFRVQRRRSNRLAVPDGARPPA